MSDEIRVKFYQCLSGVQQDRAILEEHRKAIESGNYELAQQIREANPTHFLLYKETDK